jgi:hypothetical protein
MPISSTINRWIYNGDTLSDTFGYTNKIFAAGDLRVYVDGVLKTLATDYSVTGVGAESGGGVVFVVKPPAGTGNVVIVSDPPLTQLINLLDGGDMPGPLVTGGLDKAAVVAQRARDLIDRCIRLPDADPGAGLVLPLPAERALKYLAFDPAGAVTVQPSVDATIDTSVLLVVSNANPGHVNGRVWIDTATGNHLIAKQSDGADWNQLLDLDIATGVPAFTNAAALDRANVFAATATFQAAVNGAKGADIAAAETTNIAGATGNFVTVTGNGGPITAFGTIAAGAWRLVHFSGAPQLTHNAAALILPTAANITAAAGDVALFVSLGGGDWRCASYLRADGRDLVAFGAAAAGLVPASGGGTSKFLRADATWQAPPLGEPYDSGEQTISAAGSLTLAHALAAKPRVLMLWLRCVTAEGGHSVGDEVMVDVRQDTGSDSGMSVRRDATNIRVRFGANIYLTNATTGAGFAITMANWKLLVEANV